MYIAGLTNFLQILLCMYQLAGRDEPEFTVRATEWMRLK